MYNELCFHAQQAVEKSLKAVLLATGIEFRRVHSIAYLISLLPPALELPDEITEAAGLTNYAVIYRYPGDYEDITDEVYQDAVRVARAIFARAERICA